MRVARWRWLVPMVVVVAGCLPQPTPDLPLSFTSQYNATGLPTFTSQTPPAGETGQDIVAALAADPGAASFPGRAVPVFGVIDCHGLSECLAGPGGAPGGRARTVWVVVYPDCIDANGSAGWTIVDAVTGVDGGYFTMGKCE